MADSKITALTALTSADPANDMIPIVDVSDTPPASGNTKRISINNILAASGTATLASATITGAATVGTTLGVTGVSTFAAGTALLPALTTTGDTNTGIYYPAADTFAVTTGGTERYRVDSSGNVGIGVTPSAWASVYKAVEFNGGVSLFGQNATSSMELCCNAFLNSSFLWTYKTTAEATHYRQFQGAHQWHNAPSGTAGNAITFTQAMTLDASGTLLVGATSGGGSFDTKLFLSSNSGTQKWAVGPYSTATNFAIIPTPGTGGVYLSGNAATSWTAYSDERLKDIIEPISNAVAKIGSLRAVIGKFKSDNSNTRKSFLIAQDVQLVLPEAVDASNPDRLGVAYSDVIPLLVAAIKELTAEVNALKNA